MTKSTDRQAHRAGLTITKRSRGKVYTDPMTGASVYNGNRTKKSPRHERRLELFIRRRQRGGMD